MKNLNIRIYGEDRIAINNVLNKLILHKNNWLYVISDVVYKEEDIKRTFSSKTDRRLYITECTITCYNPTGRFLGTVTSQGSIEQIIRYYDLNKLRNNWFMLGDQLKAFGFELTKIKK